MKTILALTTLAAVATGLFVHNHRAHSQDRSVVAPTRDGEVIPPATGARDFADSVRNSSPNLFRYGREPGDRVFFSPRITRPKMPPDMVAETKLQANLNLLRHGQDEKVKAQAKQDIEKHLTEVFELDMARREAEIVNVENRVKRLRAQFDKRQEASSDIIQLRLQVLVNEANGLGFQQSPASLNTNQGLSTTPSPWPRQSTSVPAYYVSPPNTNSNYREVPSVRRTSPASTSIAQPGR